MPSQKNSSTALWPWRIITFLFWYAKEFLVANMRVTADILRPRKRMKISPAIISVPAASEASAEWTLISCLITLTPGTLSSESFPQAPDPLRPRHVRRLAGVYGR